jgi:hypothetical protein
MQVVHPICCGIDVHQAQLTACLRRVDADGHGVAVQFVLKPAISLARKINMLDGS